jgi:hypothetical protein
MSIEKKFDYSGIPTVEVARILFGAEDRTRSKPNEVRFPDLGGLTVHPVKNKWFCHTEGVGGDAIALVRHLNKCEYGEAFDWLRAHGFEKYLDERPAPKTIVATYDYANVDGTIAYHVDRFDDKSFRQWREIDGERVNGVRAGMYEHARSGQWWPLRDAPRPLAVVREFPAATPVPYRLPELIGAPENYPILIPAGEKDVDNLRALKPKAVATTNHGGETKWWPELTPYFKGRRVFLLLDNDAPGEKHCAIVGAALNGVASEIRVVRFRELPPKGDVSDFIELRRKEGLDDEAIKELLYQRFREAPVWEPTAAISVAVTNDAAGDITAADWPEPTPLSEGLSPVEPLDTALLPSAIAPWVDDISERMQCPPDYIGAAALTALGAVLGRKIGVAPERQTDWYEVPNNWCCIVGRPGDLKSPAIGEALKPLHRLEVDARKAHDGDLAAYEKDLQLWRLKKDAAEGRAKREMRTNPDATIQFDIPEPQEPTERRYVTNDTSYEKLGEILAENPNGVLAHRDELVSLLKTLDREEFAPARGFFLTAWGGKDRYAFDRIGRGKTHIEAACVSILGSTQPGRLAEYVRRAVSGGAGDDGLIHRFGLLVWPDQAPVWESVDRYPNSAYRDGAWGCFVGFDSLNPGAIGAEPTSQFQSVPVLRFDAGAHDLFLEWRKDLERNLRSDAIHPALASHFAKYRKLVPTLALINHLADGGHGPIGKEAMLCALGLAEYLETHAHRAYSAGPEAETAAAKAILSHIRKGDLVDGFSARDVHRPRWSHLTDRGQVQGGLDLLCDLDWIVAVEVGNPGRGGRPTTHYRINPRLFR